MKFHLTTHVDDELILRSIPRSFLEEVLANPQQKRPAANGRTAYQSKVTFPDAKLYLLRAIVDERLEPAIVITVYRTSKIDKYWSAK